MDVGKLPAAVLARLLNRIQVNDPRVLLGARIGEDAALIDAGDHILVVKSDPITFATDLIGWYVVQINANDIAVMGATPRWFLCTLLLPQSASPADAEAIFTQILEACQGLNVTLVGGHTEITFNLDRPIAVGMMLGEAAKGKEVLTSGAAIGDALLLTKGIAIEGTALLAREASDYLASRGVPHEMIQQAQALLHKPGISVLDEAQMLCSSVTVHSMHDPTEGGLATGLWELAHGAGVGLEVDLERIFIFPETSTLCQAAELDPLGLLASGGLLATLPPEQSSAAVVALESAGIPAQIIGRVIAPEQGVLLHTSQGVEPLPTFPRDELARFLSQQ